GELTIASMAAGEITAAEDMELLGSAIDGMGWLLTDLEDVRVPDPDAIVTDSTRTHLALLGRVGDHRVSVADIGGFTVHTVRSRAVARQRADLERARGRIGLPWPTRVETTVGRELG